MSQRIAAIVVAILASYALVTGQQGPAQPPGDVPGELLVQFRPGTSRIGEDSLVAGVGTQEIRRFEAVGIVHLRVQPGQDAAVALTALRASPEVLVAGPNYIRRAVRTAPPNDPFWLDGRLWNLTRIQALEAWNAFGSGDGSVVVADIDTGVDYNHPDLAANMWRNPTEIAGNQIDDDGNGYVDDVYGIDTHFDDGDPMDDFGHGTIVAGTFAAVGNNGYGLVGVGWRTKILACKFMGPAGSGEDADAIACFNYVLLQKSRGVNIRVTNNSWGGLRSGSEQSPLKAAMDAVGAAGILNVCAAGNGFLDNDAAPFDPASFSSATIISVAASDETDARPGFSNYGATSVDLAAPGTNIWSTYPGSSSAANTGTSMAAPHVAGAAALISSIFPSLPAAGVKASLMNGVDALPAWTGVVVSGGRLNLFKALTAASGNLLPEVAITQPSAGAPFQAPATITIAATASDPDGTIASVEFFANGQSIGVDTTSPYGGQWPGVAAGTYTLTAVATDDDGGTRTSAGVQIYVYSQPGQTLHGSQTPVNQNFVGNYELGVRVISAVPGRIAAIRFWKGTAETGTHVGRVWSAAGTLLASVTFTNETASGWQTQPLPTHVMVAAETVYVVSVSSGGHYVSTGNFFATPLVNGHLRSAPGANGVFADAGTFPTNTYQNINYFRDLVFVADGGPVDVTPPTVAITAPANASTVSGAVTVTANASDDVGVTGVQFLAPGLDVTDTTAPYSVTWNTALSPNGSQTVTAIARDAAGHQTPSSISVTVANGGGPGPGSQSLHTTQTPTAENYNGDFELGVRVIANVPGQITALRFYKGTAETGTHVGRVWNASGQLLASVTFTGETPSGWQTQALPTPLNILAETVYVVSVSTGGRFVSWVGFFSTPLVNGHLRSAPGPNGVYGATGTFPASPYADTNYFRDLVFVPSGGPVDVTPPTVAITAPVNASTVSGSVTVSANASDDVGVTGVQFLAPGLDVTDTTAPYSVTWNTTLAPNGSQTVTAIARDAAGHQTPASISVTVANGGGPGPGSQSLHTTQTPTAENYNGDFELGVRVIADVPGQITALRFYKGTAETGTHVGRVWNASGALLASVTFTGETPSGWQTQALPTPLSILAETVYVVSVSTGGRFVASVGFFNPPLVNGHLRSAPYPNGIYGATGTFPASTYADTNYFRDLVFVPSVAPVDVTPSDDVGVTGVQFLAPAILARDRPDRTAETSSSRSAKRARRKF